MKSVDICKSIISSIKKQFDDRTFRNTYRVKNAFSRNRELGFEQLCYYLLNSTTKTMPINISDMKEDFPEIAFPDVSKQAVSKARKGIDPELFHELSRISVRTYYQQNLSLHTWYGYHPYAIDGTVLQIPQTKENIAEFGGSFNQYTACTALASASTCFDVLNDIVVDANIEAFCFGERKLASLHIKQMECYGFQTKTLFLFDRGYPAYGLYREIQELGQFFLMRLNRTAHKRAQNGEIFQYKVKDEPPVALRMVHVVLDDGTIERLVTNILDPTIRPEMLKELYFLRWGIECKYKEFKDRLEMEEFTGYHPICVRQGFFIAMFRTNLAAILKAEADHEIKQDRLGKGNNCEYQANRGFIINRVIKYTVKLLSGLLDTVMVLEGIIREAKRSLSQLQPGRTISRKPKNTRRTHYTNRKKCI